MKRVASDTGSFTSSVQNQKRVRKISESVPRRVVFISGLSKDVTEAEVVQLGLPFGHMTNLVLARKKCQALLEMADLESAQAMVEYYTEHPPASSDPNTVVRVRFSNYEELKTDDGPINAGAKVALKAAEDLLDNAKEPHSLLRVVIENMIYPITIDVLHKIFFKFGQVLRIVTYMKNEKLHAFIEFSNPVVASAAKNSLNGQNIYNGCCTLRVDFAEMRKLKVKYNNDRTWDYTNPNLPSGDERSANNSAGMSSQQQQQQQQRDVGRMDVMRSDAMRSDTMRSDTMRSDAMRSDNMRSDTMRSNVMRSDAMRSDTMRSNAMRSDAMRSETMRSDAMRSNAMRSDNMRSDAMRSDGRSREARRDDGGSRRSAGPDLSVIAAANVLGGNLATLSQLAQLQGLLSGAGLLNADNLGLMGGLLGAGTPANLALLGNIGNLGAGLGNIGGGLSNIGNMGNVGGNMGAGLVEGHHGRELSMERGGYGNEPMYNRREPRDDSFRDWDRIDGPGSRMERGYDERDRNRYAGGDYEYNDRRDSMRRSDARSIEMPGCVLHISNLNEEKITPDNIFKLFGVYGNVQRVKILFNKKDTALVQYSEPEQAQNACRFLNGLAWHGKEMKISLSKYTHIQTAKPGLPEAWLTKDFSDSTLHRFRTPNSKNYRNIFAPSSTLHLSNIAPNTTEEKLVDLFSEFGKVQRFQFFQRDSKMALIQMSSVQEAVDALVALHDHQLNPSSHLRVSFTNSEIRE